MEIQQTNKEGISVIISYHNESETIETTLELLLNQTLRPNEIIFVNSNSTDDSFNVIQNWIDRNKDRHDIKIRNIDEGTNVPGSSMNVGIRNASWDILAFMDCGLLFDHYWLERQMEYLKANNSEVVSGRCHFAGASIIDKSAVAQTYGYRKLRPTVPSSLVRKAVFDKTGLFLENKRAGHDVDWLNKLVREKVIRDVNSDVTIKYNGVNYAKSLKHIFLKTVKYSESTVGVFKYYNQHVYGVAFILAMFYYIKVSFFRPWPYNQYIPLQHIDKYENSIMLFLVLSYVTLRGYVIPCLKSRSFNLLFEHPASVITLPVVGFVMDMGRLIGYVKGTIKKCLAVFPNHQPNGQAGNVKDLMEKMKKD